VFESFCLYIGTGVGCKEDFAERSITVTNGHEDREDQLVESVYPRDPRTPRTEVGQGAVRIGWVEPSKKICMSLNVCRCPWLARGGTRWTLPVIMDTYGLHALLRIGCHYCGSNETAQGGTSAPAHSFAPSADDRAARRAPRCHTSPCPPPGSRTQSALRPLGQVHQVRRVRDQRVARQCAPA
jgi:hypothetical protein